VSSPTTPSQSRTQRSGNAAVRLLLRSPLHRALSGRLLTITVIGRRTGREYAIPVGYAEHDGALLVGTAGTWRRNLRPGTPVKIRLRGRDRQADPEVITDEARAAELYRAILRRNPVHGRFAGIGIEPDGSANPADLRRALARGVAVVRLSLR
jgi:deazaflavin-dependent oxidoreductase (nitroreductase family)